MKGGGIKKAELQDLPRVEDRMTFLYVERCKINRTDGSITIRSPKGTVDFPAASLSVLILGPGTDISHRAIELIGHNGVTTLWVGEHGVRYYAHGKPLSHSSNLIVQQARLVSNTRSRLAVARKMYQMRFPEEEVSKFTMQQLRGREGARVRSIYRQLSKKTGVRWSGREFDSKNYEGGDPVNRSLSAGNACLYGLAHSVSVALGVSPALGFVHTGHDNSFVFDLADLYKTETSIPLAFELAADPPEDIGSVTRRRMRDIFVKTQLIKRMIKDIFYLFDEEEKGESAPEIDLVQLWDDQEGPVESGVMY